MSASWEILPEKILKESLDVDPAEIRIELSHGVSLETKGQSRNPLRWLRKVSNLNLRDKFIFDGRFETDKNIAHQVRLVLAPMLLARKALASALGFEPEIHVVLRAEASAMSREIYRTLGIPVILSEAPVEGQIVRVSCPHTVTRHAGKFLHNGSLSTVALFPEIFRDSQIGMPTAELPEKVFISRKSTRFLLNEQEITRLLESHGFKKYYFEEVPVSEQFQVVANAHQIVAVHGAALAATVFNQRGLASTRGDLSNFRVIELFGPGYQVDNYRRTAAVFNSHWCAVRGKITAKVLRDLDERGLARSHEKSPFAVDPGTLEMALEYSGGRRQTD